MLGDKGGTVLNGTNHRLTCLTGAVKVVECRGRSRFLASGEPIFQTQKKLGDTRSGGGGATRSKRFTLATSVCACALAHCIPESAAKIVEVRSLLDLTSFHSRHRPPFLSFMLTGMTLLVSIQLGRISEIF